MMAKIKVKGKYVGASKRGTIIGGIHFVNNGQAHTVLVDEACFQTLVNGQQSGWFKILEHNYDLFCASRMRPMTVDFGVIAEETAKEVEPKVAEKVEEAKVEEAKVEVLAETEAEAVEEKPAKKKATKKKD